MKHFIKRKLAEVMEGDIALHLRTMIQTPPGSDGPRIPESHLARLPKCIALLAEVDWQPNTTLAKKLSYFVECDLA